MIESAAGDTNHVALTVGKRLYLPWTGPKLEDPYTAQFGDLPALMHLVQPQPAQNHIQLLNEVEKTCGCDLGHNMTYCHL